MEERPRKMVMSVSVKYVFRPCPSLRRWKKVMDRFLDWKSACEVQSTSLYSNALQYLEENRTPRMVTLCKRAKGSTCILTMYVIFRRACRI